MIITDGEKFYRKIMLALGVAEPTLEPTITPGDTVIMSLTRGNLLQAAFSWSISTAPSSGAD